MDGDLISRKYVLGKFNSAVFKAITNSDGLSAIDIVQDAPSVDIDKIIKERELQND